MLSEQPVTEEQTLHDSTYIMDLKTVKSIDESWLLEDGERRNGWGLITHLSESLKQEPLYLAHNLIVPMPFIFVLYLPSSLLKITYFFILLCLCFVCMYVCVKVVVSAIFF